MAGELRYPDDSPQRVPSFFSFIFAAIEESGRPSRTTHPLVRLVKTLSCGKVRDL